MKKLISLFLSLSVILLACAGCYTVDRHAPDRAAPELVAPSPAAEPDPDPEPETAPAPETEPETAPETVPETEPETEPETVPETVPETEPAPTRAADPKPPVEYVLNTSSKKIHKPTCRDVGKIADKNYKTTTEPAACLASGYTNCGHCGGYTP